MKDEGDSLTGQVFLTEVPSPGVPGRHTLSLVNPDSWSSMHAWEKHVFVIVDGKVQKHFIPVLMERFGSGGPGDCTVSL